MKRLIYIFKRICGMDFKSMFKTAIRVTKTNNASFVVVLIDIIYCGLKYMAGYVDYEIFDFYNLTKAQRETIITRGINNHFVSTLNDKEYVNILDNKLSFNEKFNGFLKRDWLNLKNSSYEQFEKFIIDKKAIIAKPINLSCGRNIEKIELSKDLTLKQTFANLIKNEQFLVEDCIIQHNRMAKLYPNAVNTLRIVTITKNKNVNIIFRSIRMGNSGNIVDNFNHGGLFTTIDNDGVIRRPAVDKSGNIYEFHPFTGVKILDFKIPFFEESIEYVKEMALKIPEVGYVGWDIAITNSGPIVVEANPFPGHDIYQSKIHMNKDGTGMRKVFENIIYDS